MINKKSKLSKNIFKKSVARIPTRDGYGDGLVYLGKNNPEVVVLSGDLTESTRSADFAQNYPDRFIQVGVAEQNMMGIAAGLALSGKIPFVSSYAVFNPGRNWDQLRVSVCYSNVNVKVAGAHAGLSVGPDGATHQALEDIAITRVIPNITVIAPADYEQTKKATIAAVEDVQGPVYLRFTREKTPSFTTKVSPFKVGRAEILREGKDLALVAAGPLIYQCLLAAEELSKKNGIECMVINSHTIKPLDKKTIVAAAKQCKKLITVEEHQISGGLGGAVAEALAEEYPVPVWRIGMPDAFGESGQPEELLEKYGLNSDGIYKKALSMNEKYN